MKKIISYLLVIALVITSFASIPFSKVFADEKDETKLPLAYHLDIGVYVVPYVEGKWVDDIDYGSTQKYTANLEFNKPFKVKRFLTLEQAEDEGIDIWNQKNFTHNIPKNKKYDTPEEAYAKIYYKWTSSSLTNQALISNEGNKMSFSVDTKLESIIPTGYDVISKYNEKVDKSTIVQSILVTEKKTTNAIKELEQKSCGLWSDILILIDEGKQDSQTCIIKTIEYNKLRKQIDLLKKAKPTSYTVEQVVTEYKLNEKEFIDEVYKFWGGESGLQAVNPEMALMMDNLKKGIFNPDDKYYLVFIPTLIEYEPLGKICSKCGKCILPLDSPYDYCTPENCKDYGTNECGCYVEPVEQLVPPAGTTGDCADLITWSEIKSHVYYCPGCKTTKDGGRYCPGHTCNHVYTYQATLKPNTILKAAKPNGNNTTFKSGYGFTVDLSNVIDVKQISNAGACGDNLKKANEKKPIPPTTAEVRTNWIVKLKDTKVTQPKIVKLTNSSSNATTSKFVTAPNPLSQYKKNQIYTDVALKGTKQKPVKHTANVYTYGGGVNGVKFCKEIPLTFTINGDMYEDDWTVDRIN